MKSLLRWWKLRNSAAHGDRRSCQKSPKHWTKNDAKNTWNFHGSSPFKYEIPLVRENYFVTVIVNLNNQPMFSYFFDIHLFRIWNVLKWLTYSTIRKNERQLVNCRLYISSKSLENNRIITKVYKTKTDISVPFGFVFIFLNLEIF